MPVIKAPLKLRKNDEEVKEVMIKKAMNGFIIKEMGMYSMNDNDEMPEPILAGDLKEVNKILQEMMG